MQVGKITFSNRTENALKVLKDELIDKQMWEEEWHKKDYENEKLREEIADLKAEIRKLKARK